MPSQTGLTERAPQISFRKPPWVGKSRGLGNHARWPVSTIGSQRFVRFDLAQGRIRPNRRDDLAGFGLVGIAMFEVGVESVAVALGVVGEAAGQLVVVERV